jgi:hypothetical protein
MKFALYCGIILLSLALAFSALLWQGYALTVSWAWFIVPVFALPALSLKFAAGLALTVRLLTLTYQPQTEEIGTPVAQMARAVAYAFLSPATLLAVGWLVHRYL